MIRWILSWRRSVLRDFQDCCGLHHLCCLHVDDVFNDSFQDSSHWKLHDHLNNFLLNLWNWHVNCSHCVQSYFRISTFRLMYTRLGALPASISVGKCGGNSSSGPTGSLATMVGISPGSLRASAQTPGVTSCVFQESCSTCSCTSASSGRRVCTPLTTAQRRASL